MLNTFFKTNFASSRTDLVQTTIPDGAIMPYTPYGVWSFGGDSASLIDVKNSNQMIAASPSTTTYDSNSMTISLLTGKHVATDITDSGDITVIGVAKYDTTGIKVLVGNILPTASTTKSNWGIFTSIDDIYLSLSADGATKEISNLKLGATLTANDYFIFAVSINKTNKTATLYSKNNGVEYTQTVSFTKDYLANGSVIALGDSVYAGNKSGTLTYSETTIYKKALTLEEIKTAVSYISARASERGITV